MKLEVKHLRCILALAETASFTAAATTLGMGQPALSRAISDAERRLGTTLFIRTTRSVQTTGDGEQVAAHARRLLLLIDDGLSEMNQFVSGERGNVRIACLPSLAATYLPPLIAPFIKSHPAISIEIHDLLRDEILEEIRSGAADLALVAGPVEGSDLTRRHLTHDEFVCLFRHDDPLARLTRVHWGDLKNRDFVGFGPESSIGRQVRTTLESVDIELGTCVQARSPATVAGLVSAGLGISVLPEFVLPLIHFAGLASAPLHPVVTRSIFLVQRRDRRQSRAVAAFTEALVASQVAPEAPQR